MNTALEATSNYCGFSGAIDGVIVAGDDGYTQFNEKQRYQIKKEMIGVERKTWKYTENVKTKSNNCYNSKNDNSEKCEVMSSWQYRISYAKLTTFK